MDVVSGIFSMIDLLTKHEKLIALNASIKVARARGASWGNFVVVDGASSEIN